ncbi:hypothetical protein U9M48_037824 [Paspalum notatum var. saurae]|uniref:Cytochrome P450 n=1 Tax=Paspalum notatum var. saurae TaxID=547442 RepID=A0AAQ3UK24_PASNO
MNHSILNNPRLLGIRARLCRDKVVNGLLPFLARMASIRTPFDMRELLTRLVFDLTATLTLGVDPGYLSMSSTSSSMMHMPSMHVCTAMDTVMEVGLLRHAMPASVWKAMRQLNVGPERKLAVAHKQLHGFVREMVAKRKPAASCRCDDEVEAAVDILFDDPVYSGGGFPLGNILVQLMVAGRDTVGTTLPWVFYSLANNPRVVSAIREELAPLIAIRKEASAYSSSSSSNTMVVFEPEETKGLVYLEAAILETLRLYPPGPLERKAVLADDVLPSGHQLCSGETILVSIYAMGRMEALWGKDCHEYRPERWLISRSHDGCAANKLRYVPSHKFMAFNSGPRLCLGKDIAMAQMKTIVATSMWSCCKGRTSNQSCRVPCR